MTPQKELTNKRPTNYSNWHRAVLPRWCYYTDGDSFEQRMDNGNLITVAYIETIQVPPLFIDSAQCEYPLWPSKKALMMDISEGMKIPCFVVRHKPSCDLFFVARFLNGEEIEEQLMNQQQYTEFICNLGG